MAVATHTYTITGEEAMEELGEQIAHVLHGGQIISLEGDLGAGKTTLVRAIARGLGITEPVTSPTYVLQKSYNVPFDARRIRHLVHYDLYRLGSYEELLDLGFEDHDPASIVLVEWGNLYLQHSSLPLVHIRIDIPSHEVRIVHTTGLPTLTTAG